ncbi:MAG: PIN domain-containing protein [Nanoarchaeota archaeon]
MCKSFDGLFYLLLRKVVVVPSEVLYSFREEALNIVKDIDMDDVLFVACALAFPGSMIWSDDKKLKRQSRVDVLNTSEMMSVLG